MAQQFFWNGATADWETANWQDAGGNPLSGTPQDGDTIYIGSGTVTVALFDQEGAASNQTIFLGSSGLSGVPTLDTTDQAVFTSTIQETGDYLNAVWIARGQTNFQGTLNVTGGNSSLVLSAVSDGGAPANPGVFAISTGGIVNVGEEGTLDFVQGTLQVDGLLSDHGGVTFESGTVLSGEGTVELGGNSALTIRGTVDGGSINFNGKNATLEIDDLAGFNGNITGFTTSDTIDLPGVVADGFSYHITPGATVGTLTLTHGGMTVDTISIAYGEGSTPTKNPFIVTTDGSSTTVQAGGDVFVKDMLPVTIFGTPGQQISLATILTEAFGSTANFDTVYVAFDNATYLKSYHLEYWTGDPSAQTFTKWSIRTPAGTPDSEDYLGAPVTDLANTYLTIGTDIKPSAGIQIPVVSANGVVTEYLEYMITVADPSLQRAPAASLTEPTPQDIVASAYAFDALYGDKVLLNYEDCEFIARDVAGAAGAVHGGNDLNPDVLSTQTANLNQPDGFWRIAYDGADVAQPVTDWFSLLHPGDIVRLGWTSASGIGIKNGHTTTILAVNLDPNDPSQSTITVYDNATSDTFGDEVIGIHTVKASHWESIANPAYITIYRLTDDGRYWVNTQAPNQIVHDTLYNDDVELVGPGDTIYGGPGNEMIRGFSADLQGVTLIDAHAGDFFQFKDATAVAPTYDHASGMLTVAYTLPGNSHGSATIQLTPGMMTAFVTAAATDGTGETVMLDQPGALLGYVENHAPEAIAPALDLSSLGGGTLVGAHVSISANLHAEDVLGFVGQNGIVGSYDAASGVLTLSGSASVADYQAALRAVTYFNASDNPSADARSINYTVDDGANHASHVATAMVTVTPVNDAPVVSGSVALAAITEDSGPHLITQSDLLANATDVDGPSLTATDLQIAKGLGTLVDNHDGTWSYTPQINDDTSVTFSYQVTDSIAAPVADSATLKINALEQALVLGTPGNDTFAAPSGNSSITGNGGTDTVVFDFKLTDAHIAFVGNDVIVDGPTGHTVLNGISIYQFADGTVNEKAGSNPLVDPLFYYSQYHDVWNAHVDAAAHYETFGWHEGRNPNAWFDTSGYLAQYTDVKAAGVDPLDHYDQFGWKEGRDPSVIFDTKHYLAAYPDVVAAHIDPLAHFVQFGQFEGRQTFADGVWG